VLCNESCTNPTPRLREREHMGEVKAVERGWVGQAMAAECSHHNPLVVAIVVVEVAQGRRHRGCVGDGDLGGSDRASTPQPLSSLSLSC